MHTMHPTLLIGPVDWEPRRLPREEFENRLARIWTDYPQAGGVIAYGEPREHAALAYLTHFTPKLEAALALLSRDGAARLLIGGGTNMISAARPLTFVEDLAPLRGADVAAQWARALPEGTSIVLIGGERMPFSFRCALDEALGGAHPVVSGDKRLADRMRVKSARELALLQTACEVLSTGVVALEDAFRRGKGVTDCILAAEHAALGRGAQDVCSLFSIDGGGTLRPFEVPVGGRVDPLQIYLAVRYDGYWADALVFLSSQGDGLTVQARRALDRISAAVRPGIAASALWAILDEARGPWSLHPVTSQGIGDAIGLSLHGGSLARDCRRPFAAGEVYSFRVGLFDGNRGAFASAILRATEEGVEQLWPKGKA
jgi:hypothetical protein